ncbi:hypothetical protein ACFSAV_03010 [Pasteurella oralis]|uniref:Transmembrane protein n=1 Tax=Pasteurella oralis TaxID=1071947 RepID=A0ABW4NT59_9PAST
MFSFIKKYSYFISLVSILIILFGAYYTYHYFTKVRYWPDLRQRLWQSVDLSKEGQTVFEFKTYKYVQRKKCFFLGFRESDFLNKVGDIHAFYPHYNPYRLTEEEFKKLTKSKPHFILNIYENGHLVAEKKEIFMLVLEYVGGEHVLEQEVSMNVVGGYSWPLSNSCYDFKENSFYHIEITNNMVFPEYKDIDTYLGIVSELTTK